MISTVHFVSASVQDTATLFIYDNHDILMLYTYFLYHDILMLYTYFLTSFEQKYLAGEKQEDENLNCLKIYSSRTQEKKLIYFILTLVSAK